MHESFLSLFFQEMNIRFREEWCILHSFETLPTYSESDVDMAFSGNSIEALETLIIDVAKETGWRVYQKLWYDVEHCNYYVLKQNDSDVFLALDFLTDNDGIARYGFATQTLTSNTILHKSLFPIPSAEVAFCYKLVKRIEKLRSLQEDKVYLMEQYANANAKEIDIFLKKQFGEEGKRLVTNYLSTQTNISKQNLDLLKRKRKRFQSSLSSSLKYFYWETKRKVNRVFYPKGMKILIPDLQGEDLPRFVHLLEKKVDILFRFVKLNTDKSVKLNFVGMAGSTLVINKKNGFNGNDAVKYKWLSSFSIPSSKLEVLGNSVEDLVDLYYLAILKALQLRLPGKFSR